MPNLRTAALLCASSLLVSILSVSSLLIGQSQAFISISSSSPTTRTTSAHGKLNNNQAFNILPIRTRSININTRRTCINTRTRLLAHKETKSKSKSLLDKITSNPQRSLLFSLSQTTAGALLGPFLDSYHSAFGVLQYDSPFSAKLWSTTSIPALTTTWWVPPLFGLAGFIIGWMYILLDDFFDEGETSIPMGRVSGPIILIGIAIFTLQYWLSGVLFACGTGMDRTAIFGIMTMLAFGGYVALDGTKSGLVTSLATAIGGPLIEVVLISVLAGTNGGYHYTDPGETGFFPLWIVPVYFWVGLLMAI
mmetsp:Transcript_26140/g.38693  ORF Transcript_26140/g.38693 Transcript_26140/m.38693 type:complete len:307 (+) Transcript_26140:142-1062(+)